MKRPLSSRLREIRHRLDFIGDDDDVETIDEAMKLAERHERQVAEGAQTTLDNPDPEERHEHERPSFP